MSKIWIKSALRKPPQGKKVLCFHNGDLSVRQRFKEYWFPIPFVDAKLSDIDEPEFWQDIDFPAGFYGYTKVLHEGMTYKMDEWEKVSPKDFNEFVDILLNDFNKSRIKLNNGIDI